MRRTRIKRDIATTLYANMQSYYLLILISCDFYVRGCVCFAKTELKIVLAGSVVVVVVVVVVLLSLSVVAVAVVVVVAVAVVGVGWWWWWW